MNIELTQGTRVVTVEVYRQNRVVYDNILGLPESFPSSIEDVDGLETRLEGIDDSVDSKMPAFEPVATYAAMAALANPTKTTFYLMDADEVNHDGNPSIYCKKPNGDLYWFAAQKIN